MTSYNISPAGPKERGKARPGGAPRGDRAADLRHVKTRHAGGGVPCLVPGAGARTRVRALESDLGKYEEDISNN